MDPGFEKLEEVANEASLSNFNKRWLPIEVEWVEEWCFFLVDLSSSLAFSKSSLSVGIGGNSLLTQ